MKRLRVQTSNNNNNTNSIPPSPGGDFEKLLSDVRAALAASTRETEKSRQENEKSCQENQRRHELNQQLKEDLSRSSVHLQHLVGRYNFVFIRVLLGIASNLLEQRGGGLSDEAKAMIGPSSNYESGTRSAHTCTLGDVAAAIMGYEGQQRETLAAIFRFCFGLQPDELFNTLADPRCAQVVSDYTEQTSRN